MSIVTSLLELLLSILQGFFGKSASPELATARASSPSAGGAAPVRAAPRPVEVEEEEPEYSAQDAADAARQEVQGWMDNALPTDSPLLEPIDGVSVEKWAEVAASLSTLGDNPDAYHRVLAEHGLDAATFESAQHQWMQRMQAAHDPMAAAAIAQIYGAAFTQTRAPVDASGEEPCSLNRYAEIMGAQSAWAQDGHD